MPVQKLNRISPLVALPPDFSAAYVHVIETQMEVTMIRAFGRLAAVLVVGLGVAAAFAATTSARPRLNPPQLARSIRAEPRTPKRPVRDALLQTGA